jgi:hypothetical protein
MSQSPEPLSAAHVLDGFDSGVVSLDDSELERLRAENARLIALLTAHGIHRQVVSNVPMSPSAAPLTDSNNRPRTGTRLAPVP